MFVFIDESGINKTFDHSTFALAYIEADNYNFIEEQVKRIERELKIDCFHWSESVWRVKQLFLDEILKLDFKVKLAVVKNPINPTTELERVLPHLIIEKNISHIYIDGKKPKRYERKIKHILRAKGLSVKKLKTVKDQQYAGIRLADAAAGLARWYFNKKNLENVTEYYKRLEKKIIVIIK